MKRLMTILLLPLFVTVQSMAAICSSQCDLDKLPKIKSTTEHQGCHQQSSESDSSSDDKNGCATKVCQLDEIIKTNVSEIDSESPEVELSLFKNDSLLGFHLINYDQVVFSTGPPGVNHFFTAPLYLQKSSFLI